VKLNTVPLVPMGMEYVKFLSAIVRLHAVARNLLHRTHAGHAALSGTTGIPTVAAVGAVACGVLQSAATSARRKVSLLVLNKLAHAQPCEHLQSDIRTPSSMYMLYMCLHVSALRSCSGRFVTLLIWTAHASLGRHTSVRCLTVSASFPKLSPSQCVDTHAGSVLVCSSFC
jgi:hypothetical protein